jgi:hypothetical protein
MFEVNQHEYDEDAICIHCGLDGAEWWHLNSNVPKDQREPTPTCKWRKQRIPFLEKSISPHPNVTQPETNLPISGLGGYDQVLRDEFEDGKK